MTKEASLGRVNWHTVQFKSRKISEAKKLIIKFGMPVLILCFVAPTLTKLMKEIAFSYDPRIDFLIGMCFRLYVLGFGYGIYKLIEAYQIDIYEDVRK